MIDIKKVISILLVLCTLLSAIPYSAFALSWDGSSAGGSTSAVNGSSTGYVIRSTNDTNCVVGYRFSVVDSSGNMKVTKSRQGQPIVWHIILRVLSAEQRKWIFSLICKLTNLTSL